MDKTPLELVEDAKEAYSVRGDRSGKLWDAIEALEVALANPPAAKSKISQSTIIGRKSPTTWAEWTRDCQDAFGGGYHEERERQIFHHGIQTVFNMMEAELPPLAEVRAIRRLPASAPTVRRVHPFRHPIFEGVMQCPGCFCGAEYPVEFANAQNHHTKCPYRENVEWLGPIPLPGGEEVEG